jgi:CRP-like cAMP-binding protein
MKRRKTLEEMPAIALPASPPAAPSAAPVAASRPAPAQPSEPGKSRIWLPPGFGPGAEPASTPAASPAPPPKASGSSFTELELDDGDSLLHVVEKAAVTGAAARGEGEDEIFSIGDDLVEQPQTGGLPQIPLFSDLPPEAFIALFDSCPLRRLGLGELVIQQGSQGDAFYVICEGAVKVFIKSPSGERRDLATLENGAFFGEMALLSEAPRSASVESASEDTQLLEISAGVLAELSAHHPQVAQALKKFCRQRLLSNIMNSSVFFRPFNQKERRDLVQRFRAREVSRNDVIIRAGEHSDGLYVILTGEVEVIRGEAVLAQLKEGEIFGEMSLLHKTPAGASVVASKRTSLLRLPREDFDQLISSHPQILVLVSELTDDRKRQNEAITSGVVQVGDDGSLMLL